MLFMKTHLEVIVNLLHIPIHGYILFRIFDMACSVEWRAQFRSIGFIIHITFIYFHRNQFVIRYKNYVYNDLMNLSHDILISNN